jgi:hypothetical protein
MWEGAWSRDLEKLFWLFVLQNYVPWLLLFYKDFKSEAVHIHILIMTSCFVMAYQCLPKNKTRAKAYANFEIQLELPYKIVTCERQYQLKMLLAILEPI